MCLRRRNHLLIKSWCSNLNKRRSFIHQIKRICNSIPNTLRICLNKEVALEKWAREKVQRRSKLLLKLLLLKTSTIPDILETQVLQVLQFQMMQHQNLSWQHQTYLKFHIKGKTNHLHLKQKICSRLTFRQSQVRNLDQKMFSNH